MNHVLLFSCLAAAFWLIRRDTAARPGISRALWVPTLWVAILASRPVSLWLGLGGSDTLEGSPLDRWFFFGLIFASLVVLSKREVQWGPLLARNWPLLLFYSYLLLTVVWSNSPLASFKRWTKEVGNIFIVLVILTEAEPLQAIRAVFVRCAYLLIPLSVVLIRYFPTYGRSYNSHSGELQITGVTTQKNSLGAMIVVCLLIFVWDWLERSRHAARQLTAFQKFASGVILVTGLWLIYVSDSKTALLALLIGIGIVSAIRLPVLHRRIGRIGHLCGIAVIAFLVLEWTFGISSAVVANLGRDLTFTGRTDVWRELMKLGTDPLFGTGFMSMWDDAALRAKLPHWIAFSAHNGYLEIYLAGGMLGVFVLAVLLLTTALRINRALATEEHYAAVRFAILVAALIANFAESNFACMTPIGFLFLIAVIGEARVPEQRQSYRPTGVYSRPYQRAIAHSS